jgi:endo-alpha-1,4-polygalactosaminidase (GH114 family)
MRKYLELLARDGKTIYSNEYEIEMKDPALNRTINFMYRISPLWL